jgi:hypothetical protein
LGNAQRTAPERILSVFRVLRFAFLRSGRLVSAAC